MDDLYAGVDVGCDVAGDLMPDMSDGLGAMDAIDALHPSGDFGDAHIADLVPTDVTDNLLGGHDLYEDGQLVAQTMPNPLGGEDVFQDGVLHHITMDNGVGGVDVHDGHTGELIETHVANVLGGEDAFQDGILHHMTADDGHDGLLAFDGDGGLVSAVTPDVSILHSGNGDALMEYDDPLLQSAQFMPDPYEEI